MHFTRFIHKAFSHKLVLPHSVWGYHSEKKDKCWLTSKAPTSRSSNLPASDVPAQFTSMSTGPNFSWAWSLSNWASRKRNKELISSQSMPIDKIYKTIRPIGKICQLQAPHQTGKDQSKGEWIKSNWPNLLLVLWRSLLGYSLEIHQLIYTAPPVRKRKKWSKLCRALKELFLKIKGNFFQEIRSPVWMFRLQGLKPADNVIRRGKLGMGGQFFQWFFQP